MAIDMSNMLFEYNMYMSIIGFIKDNIDDTIIGQNIDVYPSYPKVAKFSKPTIILQKIVGKSESIGMSGDIGQYLIGDTLMDVKGILHETIYQLDIITNGNIDKLKLTSFITNLLVQTTIKDPYIINKKEIYLKDYIVDENVNIGTIYVTSNINNNDLEVNLNDDYRTVLRVEFESIQTIVPDYEIIDFSKPINWNQTIII